MSSVSKSLKSGVMALALLTTSLYHSTNLAAFAFVVPSPLHQPLHESHHSNASLKQSRLASTPSNERSTDAIPSYGPMVERAKIAFNNLDREGKGGIDMNELADLFAYLDVDVPPMEQRALFLYLDLDGDGTISWEEFIVWYGNAAEAATTRSTDFQNMLLSRRTVNSFDPTPVSDGVLRRAVECAIAAPNRSGSEPWRFVKLGSETVAKIQKLNDELVMMKGDEVTKKQQQAPLLPEIWPKIPGWCVVTTRITPDDPEVELKDFRSTSCAMQNFMLSMWSEGVGSKWTEGPTQKSQQFADLVGIDTTQEKVVGIVWYGFTTGGLLSADPKQERKKGVDEVLSMLP